MSLVENARHWAENEATDAEKAALTALLNPPGGLLAMFNSVTLTGPQMDAAVTRVSQVPVRTENDLQVHAAILARFAAEERLVPADYAAPALHARIVALDAWCNLYDPYGLTDRDAVMTAAGRAPLVQIGRGLGFEPMGFGELVTFVTELPF